MAFGIKMAEVSGAVKAKAAAPTVDQINADQITQVSDAGLTQHNLNTLLIHCLYVQNRDFMQVLQAFIHPFIIFFQLSNQYWAPHSLQALRPYDPDVIDDIYAKEILGSK